MSGRRRGSPRRPGPPGTLNRRPPRTDPWRGGLSWPLTATSTRPTPRVLTPASAPAPARHSRTAPRAAAAATPPQGPAPSLGSSPAPQQLRGSGAGGVGDQAVGFDRVAGEREGAGPLGVASASRRRTSGTTRPCCWAGQARQLVPTAHATTTPLRATRTNVASGATGRFGWHQLRYWRPAEVSVPSSLARTYSSRSAASAAARRETAGAGRDCSARLGTCAGRATGAAAVTARARR
jgi:hypothetical protein